MSLSVHALRERARHQLERLLRFRAHKDLPAFFIAESLEQVGERAGATIAALRHDSEPDAGAQEPALE